MICQYHIPRAHYTRKNKKTNPFNKNKIKIEKKKQFAILHIIQFTYKHIHPLAITKTFPGYTKVVVKTILRMSVCVCIVKQTH